MNYELFFQHYIAPHPHTVAGSLTILAARRWSDWKKKKYIYIYILLISRVLFGCVEMSFVGLIFNNN